MKLLEPDLDELDLVGGVAEALRTDALRLVSATRSDAFNSELWFLTLDFDERYGGRACPARMVLKRNKDGAGAFEHRFYSLQIESSDGMAFVPTCYFAAESPETGVSALLLEDLSVTHNGAVERNPNIKGEATVDRWAWDGILRTLAQFHGHWWGSSSIGAPDTPFPVRSWFCNEDAYKAFLSKRRDEFQIFRQQVAGSDYDPFITVLEETLCLLPRLWKHRISERTESRQNITLSHGDCFIGQFLVPNDPGVGHVKLVDFQEASANVPAFDLGYLLSFFPPANQRETLDSLRRYYAFLPPAITGQYTFDDLLDDYQWVLCLLVFDPVWDESYQGPSDAYWGPKLRNAMKDFQKLNCLEFLKRLN